MAAAKQQSYDPALLRGVLQTTKEGVPLASLNREHKSVIGIDIPFRQLGYYTLELYLKSIPDVVRIERRNGEARVVAVADEATEHIASLVARQRTNKTKRSKVNKPSRQSFSKWHYEAAPRFNVQSWKPLAPGTVQPLFSKESSNRYGNFRVTSSGSGRDVVTPETSSSKGYVTRLPQQQQFNEPKPPEGKPPSRRSPVPFALEPKLPLANKSRHSPPDLPAVTGVPSKFAAPLSPPILTTALHPMGRGRGRNVLDPLRPPGPLRPEPAQPQEEENFKPSKPKSYRQQLEVYVQRRNLGNLVFRTFPMFSAHRRVHIATVTVNDKSFSSYPTESATVEEAEELAAKRAIEELDNIDKEKKSKRCVSSDLNNILIRVREIIDRYPNGLIHTSVPKEYGEKYDETLPDGWLDLMVQNEMIKTQKIDDKRTILYSFVDKFSNGGNPKSDTSSSSGSGASLKRRNSYTETGLPDEQYVDIFVTYVTSPMDIAFRLIDHSDDYEEMANNMDLYFLDSQKCIRVEKPREGHVYAAKVDESWHRVKVITVDQNAVLCSFVDHGDNESVDHSNIYHLPNEFHELPHQALHGQLTGLETYSTNTEMLVILMKLLVGKSLVAEVIDRTKISLTLFDTSTEVEVNINESAIDKFEETTLQQHFERTGNLFEGFLSHVTAEGEIYVQPKSDTLSLLIDTLKLAQTFCEGPIIDCKISKDMLYVAKDCDEKWQRAVVVNEDGGMAFKCRLDSLPPDNLEWTVDASKRLWAIAKCDDPLIVKVIVPGNGRDKVPHVELFRLTDGLMGSINQTLAFDKDLFRQEKPVEEPKPSSATDSTRADSPVKVSLMPLPAPPLPDVGQLVEVDCVLIASPENFVCQARSSGYDLDVLTERMQEHYATEANKTPITSNELKVGNLYACFHKTDGFWYRVLAKNVDSKSLTACIYLVDWGDIVIVQCGDLVHLPEIFQTLPYQAFYCKLSGIEPKHRDWTPEDCLRFDRLTNGKAFFARINKKKLNSDDILVVEVELFDVSTPNTVVVSELLVQEGRAVKHNAQ